MEAFAREASLASYTVVPQRIGRAPVPDVVATFDSALSIGVLRRLARGLPDGHVLAQTLQRAEDYTGERV